MSADLLREAAALMRERAEAATPSPWLADVKDDGRAWVFIYDEMDSLSLHGYPNDAEHIASWHPAVALAVADWLDRIAWTWEFEPTLQGRVGGDEALAVARAYLGGER